MKQILGSPWKPHGCFRLSVAGELRHLRRRELRVPRRLDTAAEADGARACSREQAKREAARNPFRADEAVNILAESPMSGIIGGAMKCGANYAAWSAVGEAFLMRKWGVDPQQAKAYAGRGRAAVFTMAKVVCGQGVNAVGAHGKAAQRWAVIEAKLRLLCPEGSSAGGGTDPCRAFFPRARGLRVDSGVDLRQRGSF